MLSKKTYREVVRNLEGFRIQNENDRKENPSLIPIGWGISVRHMIEHTIRANHERCFPSLVNETLQYLVKQGLLVDYAGDYTFPSNERLPTAAEIRQTAFTKDLTCTTSMTIMTN